MAASKAVLTSFQARKMLRRSTHSLMERLPSEILMKILSYLDASALICISVTNKLFCQLANDKNLRVTWELTVTDTSGHVSTLELSWSQFCKTSLTLCWSGGVSLPHYEHLSTLQLHGVRRIALSCPGLKNPGKRSLMATLDMQPLTESAQVIGQDRLVQLKLLEPGILIGVWKDQCSIAFIMFTLHFHRLVERSSQGSSDCPYVEEIVKAPFDDIDPEYGLHGYQLHFALNSSESELMSERFPHLFCHRENIVDGLIQLTAVSRTTSSQHKMLSGNVTLPWRCEALQGSVENCSIMSLTLLDEFSQPFKCVSSPVSMELDRTPVSSGYYDFDGETYLIHYQDSDIQVKMQLAKLKAKRQFILVSLDVYVNVCLVNEHFGRNH